MPDDLSGWGYCAFCRAIHERDIDGYVCSDTRPLPIAKIPRPVWWRRFGTWLWRWLTARELVCGCCGMGYREHGPRNCRCEVDPSDPDACTVHGR